MIIIVCRLLLQKILDCHLGLDRKRTSLIPQNKKRRNIAGNILFIRSPYPYKACLLLFKSNTHSLVFELIAIHKVCDRQMQIKNSDSLGSCRFQKG